MTTKQSTAAAPSPLTINPLIEGGEWNEDTAANVRGAPTCRR